MCWHANPDEVQQLIRLFFEIFQRTGSCEVRDIHWFIYPDASTDLEDRVQLHQGR